jgi:glycosyltransferase involved in cell wall biosynthesis
MRKVLFVLDRDFSSNSAIHVHSLANELTLLGMDCVVAAPGDARCASELGAVLYRPVELGEAARMDELFPGGGGGPDIVHAWTPREIVRKFYDDLRERFSFKLFVHLEDNEEHLLEKLYAHRPAAEITEAEEVPDSLSHPVRYRVLLRRAAGVTVIIERLKEFVPCGVPSLTLWPGVDTGMFYPRPANPELARELKLPLNSTTIVYPGNVHSANAAEVRSLYLAVALLNREGHPTHLVRTGRDFCSFLDDDGRWVKPFLRELGIAPRERMPEILALADLFVQPGRADHFNEYRFPSKLPEFLAMGKPVILPASNIAHEMVSGRDAWVLDRADGTRITEAAKRIGQDAELHARLSAGALEFARTRLSWPTQAAKLKEFYLKA